jgi:CRISPR-associated endonuclease Cas1
MVIAGLSSDATHPHQPIEVRSGVATLFGYAITIQVDGGHLVLEDGVGPNRRYSRFARVRHGLKRIVAIGSNGHVSLAALRWLADQDASFVMLDRDGKVLAVTGPVGPSDARLRRSQSLAHQSGVSVEIGRELISQKLEGQERLAREHFQDSNVAQSIASYRSTLSNATTVKAIRQIESQAAQAYWSAWRTLPVNFPTADLRRVPEHWRTFGTRKSPLTDSPRLAVNPANSMLNYLYSSLESEARLAAAALGLDPGVGSLHVDTDARDSLACDLMEPVRPKVDRFLLEWISAGLLRRDWFFEQRDGSCRLMAPFAERLSGSMPAWRHSVGPIAEWVLRVLWSTIRHNGRRPATHLTQTHRRNAKGRPHLPSCELQRAPLCCATCGAKITAGHRFCATCKIAVTKPAMIKAAEKGRLSAHTPEADAKRAENRRMNAAAQKAWKPTELPSWLDQEAYKSQIQPRLSDVTVPAIRLAIGVSKPYATDIRPANMCRTRGTGWLLPELLEFRKICKIMREY